MLTSKKVLALLTAERGVNHSRNTGSFSLEITEISVNSLEIFEIITETHGRKYHRNHFEINLSEVCAAAAACESKDKSQLNIREDISLAI